jgi:GTPase KRas
MAPALLARLRRKPNSGHEARDKVLLTYELLEAILHFLDPKALSRADLVNTYWHTIIRASSTLSARVAHTDKYCNINTLLIGKRGSGHDSLVTRLMLGSDGAWPFGYDPTWSPDFRYSFEIDGEKWLLDGASGGWTDFWPEYASMMGQMLANCETYMLLYAVDSRESFEEIKAWVAKMRRPDEPLSLLVATRFAELQGRKGSRRAQPCFPAAVVATKNDLPSHAKRVEPSEGAELAKELGCPFVETSAKTGGGVQEAFVEMCRMYKHARLEFLRQQRPKRISLVGKAMLQPTPSDTKERKERWWRWYRERKRQST